MKFLTSHYILSLIYLLLNHQLLIEAEKSSSSWFSPKNVNSVVELTKKAVNSSSLNHKLQIFREILSYSAGENEGWTKFVKLVGTYLLAEKDVSFKRNFLYRDFINTSLTEASPKFLKDSLMSRLRGSVWPVIEEGLQNIVKKMKNQNSSERIDVKQVGLTFDPFVIGANGLLTILYAAAFIAFVTPSMGLENLFNPDYDFDYDSLNEDGEGKEGLSSSVTTSTAMSITPFNQPHDDLIENQELFNQHPDSLESFALGAQYQSEEVSSSYLHYDGQRLKPWPSLMQTEEGNPQERIYHYFKIYQPYKRPR